MKYATFNKDGFPKAFYSDDVHGPRLVPVYGDRPVVGQTEPDENGTTMPLYGKAPITSYKPNPDTLIPNAAIELTDEQWSDLTENQGLRKWDGENVVPYTPPPTTPGPYQIAKTTPWLRMTDVEGDLVYAAMTETSPRLRAIYDAATFLSSGDPLWSTMHDILAATLSPARADELLAPET